MRVVSPDEAIQTIGQAVAKEPRLKVLGVAGPGDALANNATIETFARAQEEFPFLMRCMSTNGLMLPDKIDEVDRAGITALTITINAVDLDIGSQIYSHVRYEGVTYRGRDAFAVLHRQQMAGLREAALRGMVVKVNTVLIPGINDEHVVDIAHTVKELGAYIMNIIPMMPLAKFQHMPAPTDEQVNAARDASGKILQQFRNCMRCRADAIGVPGEEGCGSVKTSVTADTDTDTVCTPKFLKDKPVIRLQSDSEPLSIA